MTPAGRVIGIDLGTTNTVVAEAELAKGAPVRTVPVPQLVAHGQVASETLFPSVLFAPPEGEAIEDPFGEAPWVLGRYARERGQTAPRRTVTSPKSWLSHAAVDRLGPILPWGADPDDRELPRLSPVEASRRLLGHVVSTWNAANPGSLLSREELVLTVPASFDDVARELTLRAAREAGLTVRLLEEPLAAFYDYLGTNGDGALSALVSEAAPQANVLVCDVGGGTTDLTLVRVERGGSGLEFDRVAVGRHLLLGGDNMDLALAHAVESRLVEPEERLDPSLFSELVLACRAAKETLLAGDAPESVPIRVLSRGSRLVGNTLSSSLERAQVESVVLDGFFPIVAPGAAPAKPRSALVGFGLPYEPDPAVTRHIAAFLDRHAEHGRPHAVLLNGGVFQSPRVRARVLDALAALEGERPVELPAPDPDLAVARGAARFGLALAGIGPRIGSGSARAYYVRLGGTAEGPRAACLVPRGAKEGERQTVRVPGLSLVVGQPVRFDLLASDAGAHAPGQVVPVDDRLDPLPPMTAEFAHTGASGGTIPVHLEGELTAVGTLDVALVEEATTGADARRFRLAFELRPREGRKSSLPPPSRRSDSAMDSARKVIEAVFGRDATSREPRDARHLVRELERILGERATWTTDTARSLFDVLVKEGKARKRSLEHERTFWMLAGFCLRPGFGHPQDDKRVGKLVPLWSELVGFTGEARVWQQFFIAWRRVSGGLGEPVQCAIRDLVDPFLSTDEVKPKKRKGLRPLAEDEMLELAASLERVPATRRVDLGRWILERTWTDRDPRLWAALARLGARIPVYASAHYVVPPRTVEGWLDHLLREKWLEVPTAARAAVQMARTTGDRARDVSESVRRDVARRLESVSAPPAAIRAVVEYVPLEATDRAEFFGEALPPGLVLSG